MTQGFIQSIEHFITTLTNTTDVTDVCLDENAVSSDPVLAFLLDEVVVKNWCRWKYKSVVQDLHDICILETLTSIFGETFLLHVYNFDLDDNM